MDALPRFVAPMLAKRGAAFDSDQHLFEVKWDGIRALAFVESDELRAYTRNRQPLVERYPELDALRRAPPGLVLDGELVALDSAGRPDFELVLRREQVRDKRRVRSMAVAHPVTFVVFDVLYIAFESICKAPLRDRRDRLAAIMDVIGDPRIVLSEGVIGQGRVMFEQACERELEGVVAKRLDSPYLQGRRTEAWLKIKRSQRLLCAIIGFLPSDNDPDDFKSLLVASDIDGDLAFVGCVGSGIRVDMRERINAAMRARLVDTPIVSSDEAGTWVACGLYCEVSFLERTRAGMLRAPVFEKFIVDP